MTEVAASSSAVAVGESATAFRTVSPRPASPARPRFGSTRPAGGARSIARAPRAQQALLGCPARAQRNAPRWPGPVDPVAVATLAGAKCPRPCCDERCPRTRSVRVWVAAWPPAPATATAPPRPRRTTSPEGPERARTGSTARAPLPPSDSDGIKATAKRGRYRHTQQPLAVAVVIAFFVAWLPSARAASVRAARRCERCGPPESA